MSEIINWYGGLETLFLLATITKEQWPISTGQEQGFDVIDKSVILVLPKDLCKKKATRNTPENVLLEAEFKVIRYFETRSCKLEK